MRSTPSRGVTLSMNPVLATIFCMVGMAVGVVGTLAVAPSRQPAATTTTSCFGSHTVANAQRNAESWVRGGRGGSAWAPPVPRNSRVRCLPISPNDRWAECHIGPVDPAGTDYVMDCDTSEFNNQGCVSGR